MINTLFSYLLESSFCLLLFVTAYRIMMAGLTHFTWMRFYLLISLVLSIVLPFHLIPFPWSSACFSSGSFTSTFIMTEAQMDVAANSLSLSSSASPASGYSLKTILLYSILTIYTCGLIYKAFIFSRNLRKIVDFIKQNPKVKEANYWIVSFKSEMPAFSFFNYIFINKGYKQLSDSELQVIKDHERVHVKQYHTLDILLVELAGIVFWFNPTIHYLKKWVREIHEFIVDEKIAGSGENKKEYARLLLNLASGNKAINLVASFTGEHIKQRILMIAKPRTSSKLKMLFLIIAPLTGILLFSFSCNKSPLPASVLQTAEIPATFKSGKVSSWLKPLTLKDYSGLYLPSKKDTLLKPMEIVLNGNALYRFIAAEKDPYNRTVYLKPAGYNKFSYLDDSGRTIEFIVDSDNKVAGCILTRDDGTYTLFKQDC